MDRSTSQLAAAVQEAQLKHNLDRLDARTRALDQLAGRLGRTPGGQDVIHHQCSLAAGERVRVYLDDGATVLQVVLNPVGKTRELARLADRNETDAKLIGDCGTKDEAARLNTDHDVHATGIPAGNVLHDGSQCRTVAE